jgi:hypothetical protein
MFVIALEKSLQYAAFHRMFFNFNALLLMWVLHLLNTSFNPARHLLQLSVFIVPPLLLLRKKSLKLLHEHQNGLSFSLNFPDFSDPN